MAAVTIVAHDLAGVGGMQRQLVALITRLLQRGVRVVVVSRTCGLSPHPLLEHARVPGPARPFPVAYLWFFICGSILVRRRRRGILQTTGAIVVNRADISVLHLVHHADTVQALRRSSRDTAAYRLSGRVSALMSRAAERVVYGAARTNVLVGVSDEIAVAARRQFPAASSVLTIPNGVDHEVFRPDPEARRSVRHELGLDPGELIAIFVGAEWREKGLDVAAEAVRRSPGWKLLVVGPGEPGDRERDDRLLFVGGTDRPERFYAAADAFVLPSAHESAPLVVYEAAACGLPIVVTAVGGLAGVVVEGRTGWVVPRTPGAISDRLSLLRDEAVRQQMGAAARLAAAGRSWDVVTDAYVRQYARLRSALDQAAIA